LIRAAALTQTLGVASYMLRILFTILVVALGSHLANGQTAKPRTVRDYYLLLPDKYFEANPEQRINWMLDPKRGAILDVKNGYLLAPGDGAQMSITVCLFKNHDGTYTIGVDATYWEGADYSRLSFYRYVGGNLVDVTKSIVPVALPEEHWYEMPRYGTTIRVATQKRRHLYALVWNRRRFIIKRVSLGATPKSLDASGGSVFRN
jgi:hypothetical protein